VQKKVETLVLVSAYCAIAFVSLCSPSLRPEVGLPSGNYDHLLAYLLLGALTAWIRTHRIETRWLLLLIPIYAGLLEFGQFFISGRDASVENFVSSAFGAIAGVLVGKGARVLFR
jgi:VanZ family protein